MWINLLRAKLHRLTVTDANVNYQGSITLDEDLISAAGLYPFEKVQVVNVTTGERFETYVIEGPSGSGTVCLNGAAAHLAKPGDLVIVMAYTWLKESEVKGYQPKLVFVDPHNHLS